MRRILAFLLAVSLCLPLVPARAEDLPEQTEGTAAEEIFDGETGADLVDGSGTEAAEASAPEDVGAEPTEETSAEAVPTQAADSGEAASQESGEETQEPSEESAEQWTLSVTEEPEDTLLLEGMAFFYVSAGVYRDGELTQEVPGYQWQRQDGESWTDLPGQTDQVLTLENLTEADLGTHYRCRVFWRELEALSASVSVTGLAPQEENSGEEIVFINPLYEDVLTEADIPGLPLVDTYGEETYTHYDTAEEASEAMRRSIRNREETFRAAFELEGVPVTADFMKGIYAGAVAHTGVPTEGDYMRYEFGGFRGRMVDWTELADGRVLCRYVFSFLYYTSEAQEAELDGEVARVLSELELDGKDNKEIIDAIYGYLCRNVTYDYKNLNDKAYTLKYTAYAALLDGTAVCQGYAAAFYRLCLEMGIDTRVISSNAMNHAWNIVQLGKFYFYVDATWDANHAPYQYYLMGSEYWLAHHVTNGVSTLGDQFLNGDFDLAYAVPKENYAELSGAYTLTEDGTLVLGPAYGEKINNYSASKTEAGDKLTSAPWREVADKVKRIEFLPGLTYIGSNAFRGLRNLEELILPDTVETVEDSAFRDCAGLKTLVLPERLTIDDNAFLGCDSIEELTIYAGQDARFLTGCLTQLKELSLVGDDYMYSYTASCPAPWSGTGVKEVYIEYGVGKIGGYAFANCASLESLTLPKRLRYIGSYAFTGCKGLKTLIFTGSAKPTVYSGAFSGDELTCLYPCTWSETPEGSYGGTVTWKGNHAPEFVERQEPTQEADGVLAHWKCGICGRHFQEQTCDTELTEAEVTLYRETYGILYRDMESAENPNPDSYAVPLGLTLKNPSRDGYLFGGWYLDGNYKKKITAIAPGTHEELTLYPKWTAISYTLAFHANGGSGSASRRSLRYDIDTTLPSTGFKRTGYTLTGWNTAKDGSGEEFLPGQTVRNLTEKNKAAVTLYARWSPNAYLLLLDPNDGVTEASSQEMVYDQSWVLPTEAGEKLGYHISTWNTRADGRGRAYTPGKAVKNLTAQAAGQVVLHGRWTVNSYKVLFHSNGSGAKDRSQTMTYGKTTALAANGFKRTGYVFKGWSDTPEGEVCYNNKAKVTSLTEKQNGVVDLYAVWEPITYRLAFKANGGQGTMETLECTYDQETALPELAFTRPGFTFLGWSTAASGKVRYGEEAAVKNLTATQGRTVTLYALWRAHSYEIHFYGGEDTSGTMRPMLRLACGRAYTLTANGFKKPGYAFTGWMDDDGNVYKNKEKRTNFALEDGAVLDLYAQWTPIQYKITYQKLIAGDENPNPAAFTVEDDVALADPSRPGCEFLGWYLDSSYKRPIEDIPAGSRRANLTLYAKWASGGKGYGYTIAFDGNGAASGKVNPLTKRYNGTVYTLPANGFKYPGHTFLGWSLDPEAATPTWKNKAKVSNLGMYEGENVVLYAVWK